MALRVAVLGAGSIGIFHARELVQSGAELSAILGSTAASAAVAADRVNALYGTAARAYADLDVLLANERLDAISICTPPSTHFAFAMKCLEAGKHVLCEKPFVSVAPTRNTAPAEELLLLATKNGLVATVNTQWPSVLPLVRSLVPSETMRSFSWLSEPAALEPSEMLEEHLSHANSLLVELVPGGVADAIVVLLNTRGAISVQFRYANAAVSTSVRYDFTHKVDRPRELGFSINDRTFQRVVGDGYTQALMLDGTMHQIDDPLKVSIQRFVAAVGGTAEPLVGVRAVLENMRLQDTLIEAVLTGAFRPA